jgi:hypothetical protein
MRSLPQESIDRMKELKRGGMPLRAIAEEIGCSKATASFYTREEFDYPRRKYHTLAEQREGRNALRRSKPRKYYPSEKHRRLHPCSVCRTTLVRKVGGVCLKCYKDELARKRGLRLEKKAQERRERKQARLENKAAKVIPKTQKRGDIRNHRFKPVKSPCGGVPHWKLDAYNVGLCQKFDFGEFKCSKEGVFCPFLYGMRDFGSLQDRDRLDYDRPGSFMSGDLLPRREGIGSAV